MSGIEVIDTDLSKSPKCAHGPALLFSRLVYGKPKKFFACAACRDRKDCDFLVWHDQQGKYASTKKEVYDKKAAKLIAGINHHNLYLTNRDVLRQSPADRMYCNTCMSFQLPKYKSKHIEHEHIMDISDHHMKYPSEFLKPLDNAKKEAQYMFAENAVKTIVDILRSQKLKTVLCIGAPRIHEYIINNHDDMSSLLLDIDQRYLHFYSPLQFCWYNSFNHHFFLKGSEEVLTGFIETNRDIVIVTDPPFGGRVEPLASSFKKISKIYKEHHQTKTDIPMLWMFPYFMEPQIKNNLQDFEMLDYKVGYDNHPLFSDGPKGRKQGSPVRIFTNINPSLITLPAAEGYKYCKKCSKWVSNENNHCSSCKACTSKDGRTYVHCEKCERCVKPTWKHCEECSKCAQLDHKCGDIEFKQECFHCKKRGHKKRDCPQVNHAELKRKRNIGAKFKNKKIKVK